MVFICHASKDAKLVARLQQLLIDGLGLTDGDIRCTSVKGGELTVGEPIDETLQREVDEATAFIALISRAFLESSYAQLELGARLGSQKPYLLVIAPDVYMNQLPRPLTKAVFVPLSGGDTRHNLVRLIDSVGKTEGRPQPSAVYRAAADALTDQALSYAVAVSGITTPDVIRQRRTRFKHEVFAIELLNKNLRVDRRGNQTVVTVDRDRVQEIIVSYLGKEAAISRHVTGKEERLKKEDRRIHQLLLRQRQGVIDVGALGLNLRWASGGMMSVVKWRRRKWVPLFFRDIRPYGWNLALGSSERYFDSNDRLKAGYDFDKELNDPWLFILREFIEEMQVIDGSPRRDGRVAFRKIHFDHPENQGREAADRFAERHAALRTELNCLDGTRVNDAGKQITPEPVATKTILRVTTSESRL